jgi:hypothetical protein
VIARQAGRTVQTDFRRRLHVDAEGFQKLRRHDVEADGELQLDQRRRRQFCRDRIEGGVGRTAQRNDFVGEGERRALQIVKAGGGFPALQRGVLLVGDPHLFTHPLMRSHFIGRFAQDSRARNRQFTHDGLEFALDADRSAEPAILLKITRRMRHHPENVGVAVFLQNFTGTFARVGRIAIVDTGHGSPRRF